MEPQLTSAVVENLYRLYYHRILSYFYSKTTDLHVSEELTHETFLKALESHYIVSVPKDKRKIYLQKCAKNKLVDYYRNANKRLNIDRSYEISDAPDTKKELADDSLISAEITKKIREIIENKLPAKTRDIFESHYYQKQSIAKICNEQSISRYCFRKIIKGATQTVKEELSPYFCKSDSDDELKESSARRQLCKKKVFYYSRGD